MRCNKCGVLCAATVSLLMWLTLLADCPSTVVAQEPLFELPVQLVGFPVIIASVKLSNFVRKLVYSLSPQTYAGRSRRAAGKTDGSTPPPFALTALDMLVAEKAILKEFGQKACVIEEPCKLHAARHARVGEQPDWPNILRNYKTRADGMKQWYLLSVFLGDVIRDVPLCKQLAKRLACDRDEKVFVRD